MSDGTSPSEADLPPFWWSRLLLWTLVFGAFFVLGHALHGFLGAVFRSLPYILGAIVVFVFAVRRMGRTRERLTLTHLAAAALMASAWPITILIWFVIHRGAPPSGPTS